MSDFQEGKNMCGFTISKRIHISPTQYEKYGGKKILDLYLYEICFKEGCGHLANIKNISTVQLEKKFDYQVSLHLLCASKGLAPNIIDVLKCDGMGIIIMDGIEKQAKISIDFAVQTLLRETRVIMLDISTDIIVGKGDLFHIIDFERAILCDDITSEKDIVEVNPEYSTMTLNLIKRYYDMVPHIKFMTTKGYSDVTYVGKGAYSNVYTAKKVGTEETVAIKTLPRASLKREHNMNMLVAELKTLQKIIGKCNGSLLKYIELAESKTHVYIFMEDLSKWKALDDYKQENKYIEPDTLITIENNILRALLCLHNEGVAHRDIKPANIMINPVTNDIKLVDFGSSLSNENATDKRVNASTTANYASPQGFNNTVITLNDEKLYDIWSAGVVFYFMRFGKVPWEDRGFRTEQELTKFIASLEKSRETDHISYGMCKYDPKERPTIESILELPLELRVKG